MKKLIITVLFSLTFLSLFSQDYYQGLERMCWINEKGKEECYDSPRKWYHLNSLLIEKDSIFIYKQPVTIVKEDTLYSASDGAFYYYYGEFLRKDSSIFAFLTMYNCDYCASPIKIVSEGDYIYPIPTFDTLKVKIRDNGILIGNVNYTKINSQENFFPPKNMFYLDSNSIYRVNPIGQYELIAIGIKNFIQTEGMKLDNDTLRVCTERIDGNKTIENLISDKIKVDTTGITIEYLNKRELHDLVEISNKVIRYIEIGKIIDYWGAARISLSYKIIIPKELHNFKDKQYNNQFEYIKKGHNYFLINQFEENSWQIIEQN